MSSFRGGRRPPPKSSGIKPSTSARVSQANAVRKSKRSYRFNSKRLLGGDCSTASCDLSPSGGGGRALEDGKVVVGATDGGVGAATFAVAASKVAREPSRANLEGLNALLTNGTLVSGGEELDWSNVDLDSLLDSLVGALGAAESSADPRSESSVLMILRIYNNLIYYASKPHTMRISKSFFYKINNYLEFSAANLSLLEAAVTIVGNVAGEGTEERELGE